MARAHRAGEPDIEPRQHRRHRPDDPQTRRDRARAEHPGERSLADLSRTRRRRSARRSSPSGTGTTSPLSAGPCGRIGSNTSGTTTSTTPLTPPSDAVRSPTFQAMRRLRDEARLTPFQNACFAKPRAAEELYDLDADPDEAVNLAARPEIRRETRRNEEDPRRLDPGDRRRPRPSAKPRRVRPRDRRSAPQPRPTEGAEAEIEAGTLLNVEGNAPLIPAPRRPPSSPSWR